MKLFYFIVIGLLAALFSIGALAAPKDITEMTPAQVQQEMKEKGAQVYDVNPVGIYSKMHVPGAKNISFKQIAENLPKDKNTPVIFYCMNEQCMASHEAAKTAQDLGFQNVARMPAGINGWKKAGMPVETAPVK